jgi:hypothetical protein
VEENTQPTTPENEDVEAHSLASPPRELPPREANDEGPDVEGHALSARPPREQPPRE